MLFAISKNTKETIRKYVEIKYMGQFYLKETPIIMKLIIDCKKKYFLFFHIHNSYKFGLLAINVSEISRYTFSV